MLERYKGVRWCPDEHKRFFRPYVTYKRGHYYLKTWRDPVSAARVRDIAHRWVHGPNAQPNFPVAVCPKGITEGDIARWLIEAGIPLAFLVTRVPLRTLLEAGVTESSLLGAGVPLATLLPQPTSAK